MPRCINHRLGFVGLLALAACTGTSGTTCGGVKPLPAGFKSDARVENAASARLTDSGMKFLEANIPALTTKMLEGTGMAKNGVIEFPVPETTGDAGLGNSYTLCPGGPDAATGKCIAEIDIGHSQIKIASATPHHITASGPVPIRVKNLPVSVKALGFIPIDTTAVISGGGKGQCDQAQMTFKDVTVTANISIEVERDPNHAARLGYTKINIAKDGIQIDKQALLDALHLCPENLTGTVMGWFIPLLGDTMLSGFSDQISSTVNGMLCQKADPNNTPQCPTGSEPKDGTCVYQDGTCVPIFLGMEGNADLGSLFASISPGVTGSLDFLFAAGGQGARPDDPNMGYGDLNPVKSGATIGLLGGVEPTPSECVPLADLKLPTNIPIPGELLENTIDGWTGEGPHVAFALSESFLNHALGGVYNSGALCIGISTEQVNLLHTGIVSLLIPSIKNLTYQKKNQPLAVVVRPQKPPTIALGTGASLETDPLMRVKLDQAMLDFYAWSSDRYVRILTAQFDFDVPINLEVGPDGITPKLDKINVANPKVTNSELLKEDPTKVGNAIADVIQGMAGDFLGSLPTVNPGTALSSFGLTLEIPPGGLKKVTSGQEDFLGVWARFGVATTTPASLQSDTQVRILEKSAPVEGFRLATHDETNKARLRVRMESSLDDGQRAIEYSYKLNRGYWHTWTRDREIMINDPILIMQGRHELQVVSRVVGQPMSIDRTPAKASFILDVDAPKVTLNAHYEGGFKVRADDIVSGSDRMMVRYRFDDGAMTEWTSMASFDRVPWNEAAKNVTVEVKDEEGNIGSVQQAVIRGRPDKTKTTGTTTPGLCSVGTPGGSTSSGAWYVLAGAAALGMALGRRNRRKAGASAARRLLGSLGAMLLAGSWAGCTCSSSTSTEEPVPEPEQDAAPEAGPLVTLEPGLIGSYTSVATASDGTLWVAGYLEADWDNGNSYGDLVVGKYDETLKRVKWEIVDGVPTEPAPDPTVYDINGFRGGQTEPGDDVGLWTSVAIAPNGKPAVAYYDATNGALKYAAYDGTKWKIHEVWSQASAESGRYAKLVFVGGKPAIGFQSVGPAPAGGFARSAALVALATKAEPAVAQDWNMQEVEADEATPCRQKYCQTGEKCQASTMKCTAVGKCTPDCASGTACINNVCEAIIDNTKIDSYPDATGGYIAMATAPGDQLGVVFYDRIRGNLKMALQDKGEFGASKLVDGEASNVDTGDVGIGAALFITSAGDWHVAYVDGWKEALKYVMIKGGTEVQTPEWVDLGTGVDGTKFADGHHMVGDDANIWVTKSGDVHIAYQDSTTGKLRWAVGTPQSGAGHKWTVKEVAQDGFAGFFPKQIVTDSSTRIVNWWRTAGSKTVGDVRVVTPPAN